MGTWGGGRTFNLAFKKIGGRHFNKVGVILPIININLPKDLWIKNGEPLYPLPHCYKLQTGQSPMNLCLIHVQEKDLH